MYPSPSASDVGAIPNNCLINDMLTPRLRLGTQSGTKGFVRVINPWYPLCALAAPVRAEKMVEIMRRLVFIVAMACGCGSDVPKKTQGTPTPQSDMGISADMETDAGMPIAEQCEGFEVLHDDTCVVPNGSVSVRLTAESGSLLDGIGRPLACATILNTDEATARSWPRYEGILAQTGDCVVLERIPEDERMPFPYSTDPEGFESLIVRNASEEWQLNERSELLEGCITELDSADFVFGETYEVEEPLGGVDKTFFPTSITIPNNPEPTCLPFVSGEAHEVKWTSDSREEVRISVRSGELSIECTVDDIGEYSIPAELTSLLPDDRRVSLEFRTQSSERYYNDETDTLTTFLGDARIFCDL